MLCQFLLYNKMNQLYVYIYPHISSLLCLPPTLPIPPLRSSQSAEPISLCCAAASHQPTILHSVVYICRCYSHFAPASPSYPMSSSPFSMSTSLFLPCNQVHEYHFFFFQILFICCLIQFVNFLLRIFAFKFERYCSVIFVFFIWFLYQDNTGLVK